MQTLRLNKQSATDCGPYFCTASRLKTSRLKMIYHHEKRKCKQRPQQIIELSSNPDDQWKEVASVSGAGLRSH